MESYSVEAILTATDRSLSSTLGSANRNLSSFIKSTTQSTKGMSGMTKSFMMGGLATKAVSTGVRMIGSSVGGAVKRFDTLQNSSRVFESMKFSAEESQGAVDYFAESLDGLPTGLDQAIRGTQSFAGVTGDLDKSAKTWDALNKAVLGFGGSADQVDRATDQLTKSFSKGTVDGNAFASLIQNGLGGALQEMARRMGHNNIDELQEAFNDGIYDANDFMDALIDLSENGSDSLESLTDMAFAQTEGIGTAWMLVGSRITQGVTAMIEGIESFLSKLNMPSIAQMLNKFSYGVRSAMRNAGEAIEAFADKLKPFEAQIKAFFDMSDMNPMKLVGGFAQVAGAVLVADKAINMMARGMEIWESVSGPVIGAINNVKDGFISFGRHLATLPTTIGQNFAKLAGHVRTFGSNIVQAFPSITTAIDGVKGAFETLALKGMYLKDNIGNAFGSIVEKGRSLRDSLGSKLPESISGAFETLALKGMYLQDGLRSAFETIALKGMYLQDSLSSAFETIALKGMYLKDAFAPVGSAISGMVQKFGGLGMQITSMTGKAIGQLAMMGLQTSVVGGVIAGALLAAGWAYENFGHQIDTVANLAITQGPQIITNLADGIMEGIPALMESGVQALALFAEVFSANFPVIVQKGVEIIQALNRGLVDNMGSILESAASIVMNFIGPLIGAIPELILSGQQLILALVEGVMERLPELLQRGAEVVPQFIQGVISTMSTLIATGARIIMTFVTGLMNNLPQIIAIGTSAVVNFIQGIGVLASQLLQVGVTIVKTLISGITSNLGNIIAAAGKIISSAIKTMFTLMPQFIRAGAQIIVNLVKGLWENRGSILDGIRSLISDIGSALWEGLSGLGSEIIIAIVEPFGTAGEWVLDKMGITRDGLKETTEEIKQNTKSDLEEAAQGGKDAFGDMDLDITMAEEMAGIELATQEGIDRMMDEIGRIEEGSEFFGLFGDESLDYLGAFSDEALGITQQTTAGVEENTAPVVDFAGFYDLLGDEATRYLGEYEAVVDMLTAETGETAYANSERVLDIHEWFDMLPEWTRNGLERHGFNVDEATREAAQKAVDNSAEVKNSVPHYEGMVQGVEEAVGDMGNNVPASAQNTAQEVTQSSSQVEQAKQHYENLSIESQSSIRKMNTQILQLFRSHKNDIQRTTQSMRNEVVKYYERMGTDATEQVDTMSSDTQSEFESMQQAIQSTMDTVVSNMSNSMTEMSTTISTSMAEIVSTTETSMTSATTAMNNAASSARMAGYNMGMGFYSGLSSTAGSIISLAQSIAIQATNAMSAALKTGSPSRVTRKLGGFTGEGYHIGLEDWNKSIIRMSTGLATSAINGLKTSQDAMSGFVSGKMSGNGLKLSATQGERTQPQFNISLEVGGYEFKNFTTHITEVQNAQQRVNTAYGGAY